MHVQRGHEVQPSLRQPRLKGQPQVYLDRSRAGLTQQREETREAEVGLVGDEFGTIQTGQLQDTI